MIAPEPSIPERWLKFLCMKCSTHVRMQVTDNIRYRVLFALPTERVFFSLSPHEEELNDVEDCLPCPLCSQERGGFYPLLRVVEAEEQTLRDCFESAVLAVLRTPEPEKPETEDPKALAAFEAAHELWDGLPLQIDVFGEKLVSLGYGTSAVDDFEQRISDGERRRLLKEEHNSTPVPFAGSR